MQGKSNKKKKEKETSKKQMKSVNKLSVAKWINVLYN